MNRIVAYAWIGVIALVIVPAQLYAGENWYEKGKFFARFGRHDKAVQAFSKAIEIFPEHADAYNGRGAVRYVTKDYKKAIEDYSKAIALSPESVSYYINRAAVWFKLKKYQSAVEDYTSALKRDPKEADAYNNRGMAWYYLNELDKAIADYSKAVSIYPDNPSYYINEGAALFRKEKLERAIVAYTRALALEADSLAARRNRGITFYYKGLFKHAAADFTQALAMAPDSVDLWIFRGTAYYGIKAYKKAMNDFLEAVRRAPQDAEALQRLAWMLSVCPDPEFRNGKKAVELAQDVLYRSPGYAILEVLAAAHAASGDYEQAVAVQEKTIGLAQDDAFELPEATFQRLKAYQNRTAWQSNAMVAEKPVYQPLAEKMIQVNLANIRSEQSLEAFIIEQRKKGDMMSVVGRDGKWFLVELDTDFYGWCREELISP